MSTISQATEVDPQTVCTMLAAVRAMARITGHPEISLRIALSAAQCPRCKGFSEMFIEPAEICTVCWSVLILHAICDATKVLASLRS
jgi:hypothetical protein